MFVAGKIQSGEPLEKFYRKSMRIKTAVKQILSPRQDL